MRPHLPINLTDLSVNRKSQLPLRLPHEGCYDEVIKCGAQDLARCQPELLRGGWTLVSVERLPTASLGPNMSLLSSGPLLLPVGGEGRQEWVLRDREQNSNLWPAGPSHGAAVAGSTQLPGEYPQFMAPSARTGLVTRTDCAMRLRVCPSPCRGFYLVAWRSAPDLRCSPCRCSGAGIACLHEDGSRGEHELACHGD